MGMKHRIRRTSNPDSKPITEAFQEFIMEKEARNLAAKTVKNYTQSFEYFMDFNEFTPSSLLSEVKPSHFFHWMNTLKLDGVRHTSINHYLRDCRAFFYWCMDRGFLEPFKIEMAEGQEELPKMFTDEELELLLVKPKDNDSFTEWRTWAIVNWVLATGNRAATICDIECNDIDYQRKEIALGHTKAKKAQIIPLSPSLENALKEYTRKFEIDGWLFPNIGVEQLTTNALSHSFSRYCKARGVSRTNIHGLRHNFARAWIRNNGSHFALQKLLGHATLDMTRHYVKLFSEDIKEDFEQFNPLDNIKKGTRRTSKIQRRG